MKEDKPAGEIEQQRLAEHVLGWTIVYSNDTNAPRLKIDHNKNIVEVSTLRAPDRKEMYRLGALAAAREVATIEAFRGSDPKEVTQMFADNPPFVNELLRLTGARVLRERDPDAAERIALESPNTGSLVAEFKAACAEFVATGAFPKMTEPVQVALETLPTSPKSGEHLLTAFTNGNVALSRKRDYFNRFFAPALERLREIDANLRATDSENFQPSTDDSPEGPEILEEDIEQRVEPFIGGYFREKVLDGVDWDAMRVVSSGANSERLQAPDEERDPATVANQHIFSGRNGARSTEEELTIPLRADSLVLPETLSKGFAIRQTSNGVHTIEWAGEGAPPNDYKFSFARVDAPTAWQFAPPTEGEQGIPDAVVATLKEETRAFLEELRVARVTDEP